MSEIVDLAGTPFVFSQPHNRFIAIGCNIFASMKSLDGYYIAACISFCEEHVPFTNYVLTWLLWHQMLPNSDPSISRGIQCNYNANLFNQVFNATIEPIINQECKYAFLAEQNWFEAHVTNPIELVVQNRTKWAFALFHKTN